MSVCLCVCLLSIEIQTAGVLSLNTILIPILNHPGQRRVTRDSHYILLLKIWFQFIQPICLPEEPAPDNKYDDDAVHLIGWGSSSKNGQPSKRLRRVILQIYSHGWVFHFMYSLKSYCKFCWCRWWEQRYLIYFNLEHCPYWQWNFLKSFEILDKIYIARMQQFKAF